MLEKLAKYNLLDRKQRRINSLELENDTLKETIKDELYKTFMSKLAEPMEVDRLRHDNKMLRKKIKILQECLKDNHYSKVGKK